MSERRYPHWMGLLVMVSAVMMAAGFLLAFGGSKYGSGLFPAGLLIFWIVGIMARRIDRRSPTHPIQRRAPDMTVDAMPEDILKVAQDVADECAGWSAAVDAIAAAILAERERCADVAANVFSGSNPMCYGAAQTCAAAIRSQGQK